MMYDPERAQQPQDEGPGHAKEHGPQPPRTAPARPPHEPVIGAVVPDRNPGSVLLLPQGERDRLTMRLQHALSIFVESPNQAMEEADGVLDESVTQLAETLAERRRVLRTSRQDKGSAVQTEELRLALRQYREAAELLLRM